MADVEPGLALMDAPPAKALTDLAVLDTKVGDLPHAIKNKAAQLLEVQNPDRSEMNSEQFDKSFKGLIDDVRTSPDTALDERQKAALENFQTSVSSENTSEKDIVNALKTLSGDPRVGLSQQEKIEASTLLNSLSQEAENPLEKRNFSNIKERFHKVVNIFKILGIALLALFGLGIFKGLKGEQQRR